MDPLTEYRLSKDEYLASNPHSPLPPELQADFGGLPYFPPNPDLVFTVPVIPGDRSTVKIAATDGTERVYHRAGSVRLPLGGGEVKLTLFDTGHPGYFLPFRDATSGTESYGAGRYLDLRPHPDGTVTIDFNYAYNPFCAYSDRYSCALPPAENWLQVPIRAGERSGDDH